MERMTDDATKKKRELEHELTLTMTAQVSYMKMIILQFYYDLNSIITQVVIEMCVLWLVKNLHHILL